MAFRFNYLQRRQALCLHKLRWISCSASNYRANKKPILPKKPSLKDSLVHASLASLRTDYEKAVARATAPTDATSAKAGSSQLLERADGAETPASGSDTPKSTAVDSRKLLSRGSMVDRQRRGGGRSLDFTAIDPMHVPKPKSYLKTHSDKIMDYEEESPLPEMHEADEQGPDSPMHVIRSYVVDAVSDDEAGYDTTVGDETDLDFSSDDALVDPESGYHEGGALSHQAGQSSKGAAGGTRAPDSTAKAFYEMRKAQREAAMARLERSVRDGPRSQLLIDERVEGNEDEQAGGSGAGARARRGRSLWSANRRSAAEVQLRWLPFDVKRRRSKRLVPLGAVRPPRYLGRGRGMQQFQARVARVFPEVLQRAARGMARRREEQGEREAGRRAAVGADAAALVAPGQAQLETGTDLVDGGGTGLADSGLQRVGSGSGSADALEDIFSTPDELAASTARQLQVPSSMALSASQRQGALMGALAHPSILPPPPDGRSRVRASDVARQLTVVAPQWVGITPANQQEVMDMMPVTIPDPPREDMDWVWLPEVRSAVLMPMDGWSTYKGWAVQTGMSTFHAVVCPSGEHPARHMLGLDLRVIHGVASHPFHDGGPAAFAEHMVGHFMRELETGASIGSTAPEGHKEDIDALRAMALQDSPAGNAVDAVDSWSHSPVEGVTAYGLEFVCRRPLGRARKRMKGDLNPSFVRASGELVQLTLDGGNGSGSGDGALDDDAIAGLSAEEILRMDEFTRPTEDALETAFQQVAREQDRADRDAKAYGFNESNEDRAARMAVLQAGLRVSLTVTVNEVNDLASVVAFSAPTGVWVDAWEQHGRDMVDHCYVNWADLSPDKFE